MPAMSVETPFPIFTDRKGEPLEAGNIYLGTANLNPQSNPIVAYWDVALTIPAAQPIRTVAGYPARNGTPARVYVDATDFSITVRDKNGTLVYTSPVATMRVPASSISADDGSSGSIFTTVQGFITRLKTSIGSSLVGFIQAGTGAVARTAQDKMREIEVNLADFGTLGDSVNGDDSTWLKALNYISELPSGTGVQGVLVLPRAATYLASPIKPGPNTVIRGKGLRFASQVIPIASFSGNALFDVSGSNVTGGFNFYVSLENFLIDCTNVTTATMPIVVNFDDSYSCGVDNIYVRAGCGKVIYSTGCNDLKLKNARIFGAGTTLATHGIHIDTGTSATIISPDLELTGVGILQSNDAIVTVIGGYAERNIRGWKCEGSTSGSMSVHGGLWRGVNSGTIVADVVGNNCSVFGGKYVANGGAGLTTVNSSTKPANVVIHGASGNIEDPKNWCTSKIITDIVTRHESTVEITKSGVVDNTATDLFRVVCPNSVNNYGYVDIDILVVLTSVRYSMWAARYRIAFGVAGGAILVTPVAEYGKANVNLSANYALAVTVSAVSAIPNLNIQITCQASGALGEGGTSEVMAKATLIQPLATGAVYITSL